MERGQRRRKCNCNCPARWMDLDLLVGFILGEDCAYGKKMVRP